MFYSDKNGVANGDNQIDKNWESKPFCKKFIGNKVAIILVILH